MTSQNDVMRKSDHLTKREGGKRRGGKQNGRECPHAFAVMEGLQVSVQDP